VLAKNQNSLPNFSEEFQDTQPESVFSDPEFVPAEDHFTLERSFLEALFSDEAVQTEVSRRVEGSVEERLAVRLREEEPRLEELRESARTEGFKQGYADALIELQNMQQEFQEEFYGKMNLLCSKILEEKEALLKDHEPKWAHAMTKLLKRFQVNRAGELGQVLDQWLSEVVGEFADKQQVRVFLPETEYTRLSAVLHGSSWEAKWELVCDGGLSPGEVRYECGGGGVFFSAGAELEKLESLVKEFDDAK
jgi:flagellar biosynthesis/type III secretory pathway protein FliH